MSPSHIDRQTLIRYLDDALDREGDRAVELHIEECLECREVLRSLAELSRLPVSQSTLLPPAPEGLPAAPVVTLEGIELPQVPGYSLSSILGEGGMGIVFLGRDTALGRPVAVKVMKSLYSSNSDLRRRFLEEAQVTSQLQHPGIPPVHALGILYDGRPFFAMKVIKGRTLTKVLAGRAGAPGDVSGLLPSFIRVCEALAYAHSKGVIHRDLKPSNVMVGAFGEVLVMDWGLAKVLKSTPSEGRSRLSVEVGSVLETERTSDSDEWTKAGSALGTWAYMPPEQARGDVGRMDRRSDVFGLGAMLCELLTGQAPYVGSGDKVRGQALAAHLDPAHERLASCGADRELIELATRCLSEDPEERPADAGAVASSISAYMANVEERLRRADRERIAAEARAAAEAKARDAAEAQAKAEEAQAREARARAAVEQRSRRTVLVGGLMLLAIVGTAAALLLTKNQELGQALKNVGEEFERAERERDRAQYLRYIGQVDRSMSHWREGNVPAALDLRDRCQWDLRGWEHRYVHTLLENSHGTLRGHTDTVNSVAYSPDGNRIVSASRDKTLKVWDARTGQEIFTLKGHTEGVSSGVNSPDGSRIASSSKDQTVKVWDARTGQEIHTLKGHTEGVNTVVFSPDGSRIASSSPDKTVKVWDARTGQETLTLKGHTGWVSSVVFSPDGNRVAGSFGDIFGGLVGEVKVWDARTGQETLSLQGDTHSFTSVVFSPEGSRIASASGDKTVKVWDARTGQETLTLKGHTGYVDSVVFSPDGSRIASASGDINDGIIGELKVWDARTGQETLTLKGHLAPVTSVVFSPDGNRIASASWDKTLKVWDARTGQETLTLKGHTSEVFSVVFSPDGSRIASASMEHSVRVWDARTRQETLTIKGHTDQVSSVCFSPDGSRLASSSMDHTVKVWDARTGQETLTIQGNAHPVQSVAFSPDGSRIASAPLGQTVKVWDARTGQETLTLKGHTWGVTSLAYSPDGNRIVSASRDQTVKVCDARTGQETLTLKGHTSGVNFVTFSPDGSRIASASDDKTVKVWDARTGQETLTFMGHTGQVNSVCFGPDGCRIASASRDKMVSVWDPRTGHETLTLRGHTSEVTSVCFSPDGSRIASGSWDNTLKVWDARTGQETLTLDGQTSGVTSLCFSPDGSRIASGSRDNTLKVWDARTGQETLTIKGHTRAVRIVVFGPDGRRIISKDEKGIVRSWNMATGLEIQPNLDTAPDGDTTSLSPDKRWRARASETDIVLEPANQTTPQNVFWERLYDPLMDVPFRLEQARLAQVQGDERALAFHLRPLTLQSVAQSAARPHGSFPLWAKRIPVTESEATQEQRAVALGWLSPLGFALPLSLRYGVVQDPQAIALGRKHLDGLHEDLSRLTIAGGSWEAWVGRGWVRHLRGDVEGALADLRQAITLRPGEPVPWAMMGVVALRHGQVKVLEEVRQRLVSWPGIDITVWHLMEAEACEEERVDADALWHYHQVARNAPTPRAWLRIGQIHIRRNREKEAFQAFGEAYAKDPEDPQALTWRAYSCAAQGDQEGYRKACEGLLKNQTWHNWSPLVVLQPAALANYDTALRDFHGSDEHFYKFGLLLRAGKAQEAAAGLSKAEIHGRSEPVARSLLLALAERQLGHKAEAQAALLEAKRRIAEPRLRGACLRLGPQGAWGLLAVTKESELSWEERLTIRLLLAEAEAAVAAP